MRIIGIETSGREGSLALREDGRLLEVRDLSAEGRRHAQTLVAELVDLCQRHGHPLRECEAVGVSVGPGSFTGLRVGVVCARTLAYSTGCRLAGVDTFAAIAEASPADVDRVLVVADAQRSQLFVGEYLRNEQQRWERAGEIRIVDATRWCADRTPEDCISGPVPARCVAQLEDRCHLLPESVRYPTAANVAALAERTLTAGGGDDLWTLAPFYFRKSAAEEKWEREHPGD